MLEANPTSGDQKELGMKMIAKYQFLDLTETPLTVPVTTLPLS
jgi:hypothetical protein